MASVGLDLATSSGVAVWYKGTATPTFTTLRLPGDPGEVGRPCEVLRAHLADIHTLEPIEHLFFEAGILPGKTNIQTIYKLCALAGMAEWFAHRIGAKCRQVDQQSWRKHFMGRGTGRSDELKRMAMDACRQRGWVVRTDHEADALGTLDYGLHCLGIKPPWAHAHLFGGAFRSAA